MKEECNFIRFCQSQIDPFSINMEESDLYYDFGLYLTGDELSLFNCKKGALIKGVVGSGKTIMFKMAQRFPEKNCRIKFINAHEVVSMFELNDEKGIEKYLSGEWVFDDLGTEQKANNYGKAIELFKVIIERRYDKWKFNGLRTHFTTNSSYDEIKEKYGDRVYDRIKEMTNQILYPSSESKRGKSTIKPLTNITDMPDKTEEQKESELKLVMDEIFDEMNEHYKKGVTSFSFNNGIKYFGCLKYFDMMPDYKSAKLWNKAKESVISIHMCSLDKEGRSIIAYIKDSKAPLSDELKERVRISTVNSYKGLLVSKCLNDYRDISDDLLDCRE